MNGGRRIVEILLVFAAFFLPGYLTQAAAAALAPTGLAAVMMQVVTTGIPQILLMIYLVSVQADGAGELWGLVRLDGRDVLRIVGLVAASAVLVVSLASLPRILPRSWQPFLYRGQRWMLERPGQIPLALLFGLTAGYREEFFFRAYLLRRLGQAGLPPWAAVALSTALFAAGHLYEGIIGVAIAASLGALFSVVYLRRPNLHVIAVSHGLYNTAALCAGLLDLVPRALARL